MIKFKWNYTTYANGNSYIEWHADWDGRWDNDPLAAGEDVAKIYDMHGHPFLKTFDYIDSDMLYNKFINMSLKDLEQSSISFIIKHTSSYPTLEEFHHFINKEYCPDNVRSCGDIVAINPVTRELCSMLSEPEVIKNLCGNTHPLSYRIKLFGSLSELWD